MEIGNELALKSFNSLGDYNKIFKQDQENVKEFSGTIQENIMNNDQLKNDKELSSDLKQLLGTNSVSGMDGTGNSLSADKLYTTFSGALSKSMNNLNNTQVASDKALETFASGGNIDVHQVMLASRKATLSMEMALKMQSKMVQAYQELSRMQV